MQVFLYKVLVSDTVVFSTEFLILKETATMQEVYDEDSYICNSSFGYQIDTLSNCPPFTWRLEKFLFFKETMYTRGNFL